ncbi:Tetratricopeptide repeat [Phytophthora cactorum]|nr:Tetratricopeptide repeat [Phytophthora cactorum]
MHTHTKIVTSAGDAAAYMELVDRSNECTKLIKAGNIQEAATLLRDVLARKPAAGFDEVSVALTQNELGGVLRQLGELDEALELLTKALEVRDRADEEADIITIALRDGNFTREEIGKVYEAKGDCAKALEVRQPGKRICGNEACDALDYESGKLHACSRCKCVFYCGKTCQRQDWKNRHKTLCQPVKAA